VLFRSKDTRASKYAIAYIRSLYNAWELLTTGTFTIRITDTEIGPLLAKYKAMESSEILQEYSGEVINTSLMWEAKVREAYESNPHKQTDMDRVNKYLVRVRKQFF
jgi:hypothetical protein